MRLLRLAGVIGVAHAVPVQPIPKLLLAEEATQAVMLDVTSGNADLQLQQHLQLQQQLEMRELGITPSWALASNAVPLGSNSVRSEHDKELAASRETEARKEGEAGCVACDDVEDAPVKVVSGNGEMDDYDEAQAKADAEKDANEESKKKARDTMKDENVEPMARKPGTCVAHMKQGHEDDWKPADVVPPGAEESNKEPWTAGEPGHWGNDGQWVPDEKRKKPKRATDPDDDESTGTGGVPAENEWHEDYDEEPTAKRQPWERGPGHWNDDGKWVPDKEKKRHDEESGASAAPATPAALDPAGCIKCGENNNCCNRGGSWVDTCPKRHSWEAGRDACLALQSNRAGECTTCGSDNNCCGTGGSWENDCPSWKKGNVKCKELLAAAGVGDNGGHSATFVHESALDGSNFEVGTTLQHEGRVMTVLREKDLDGDLLLAAGTNATDVWSKAHTAHPWNEWCDKHCIPERWGGLGPTACIDGTDTGAVGCVCKEFHGEPITAAEYDERVAEVTGAIAAADAAERVADDPNSCRGRTPDTDDSWCVEACKANCPDVCVCDETVSELGGKGAKDDKQAIQPSPEPADDAPIARPGAGANDPSSCKSRAVQTPDSWCVTTCQVGNCSEWCACDGEQPDLPEPLDEDAISEGQTGEQAKPDCEWETEVFNGLKCVRIKNLPQSQEEGAQEGEMKEQSKHHSATYMCREYGLLCDKAAQEDPKYEGEAQRNDPSLANDPNCEVHMTLDPEKVDDEWCVTNCNAAPPNCPKELCTCAMHGTSDEMESLGGISGESLMPSPSPSPSSAHSPEHMCKTYGQRCDEVSEALAVVPSPEPRRASAEGGLELCPGHPHILRKSKTCAEKLQRERQRAASP